MLREICVTFCVKNPSLAHRAGVKGEVKGQIRAYHLNNLFSVVSQSYYIVILYFISSGDAEVAEGKKRPVIIHRAILGSVERMIAILTENYGGKWSVFP